MNVRGPRISAAVVLNALFPFTFVIARLCLGGRISRRTWELAFGTSGGPRSPGRLQPTSSIRSESWFFCPGVAI